MKNPHTWKQDYAIQKRKEIAENSVALFDKGYTLNAIVKRLYGSFHALTGYTKNDITIISANAIADFVREENRQTRREHK